VYFLFVVFGCQYQCNQLPGKTRLGNDLLCVECDIKPHISTNSAVESVSLGVVIVDACNTVQYADHNTKLAFMIQ